MGVGVKNLAMACTPVEAGQQTYKYGSRTNVQRVEMADAPENAGEWEVRARLEAQRLEFQRVVDEANAALKRLGAELNAERSRREETEAELENLKKGSTAMTKYVTNLQHKKHDEELADLQSQLRASEAKRRELEGRAGRQEELDYKQKVVEAPLRKLGERGSPGLREEDLARRERELLEQFHRLKEDRELGRQEGDEAFTNAMNELPEMQTLIVERDEKIKELVERCGALDNEVRRLRAIEGLTLESLSKSPKGEELRRRIAAWDDEIGRLRHQLADQGAELENVKADFVVKMRNTVAIQRIAYEKRTEELEKARGPRRSPFGRKRGQ